MIAAKCDMVKCFLKANYDTTLVDFIPLQPLPSSDLHIVRSTGQPSKGGLLMSFVEVYKFQITACDMSPVDDKDVIDAHHFPDDKIFLPPDVYGLQKLGSYPHPAKNIADARKFYVDKLRYSSSNCDGCCGYVAHSYYMEVKRCFPNAYLIDASNIAEHEQKYICVVTKDDNLNQVVEQTSIRIQRIQSESWKRLRKLALPIADHLSSSEKECFSVHGKPLSKEQCNAIRLPVGFDGSMYALGKHVDLFACQDINSTLQYCMYNGTEKMLPFLTSMSKSLCHLLLQCFHWESVTMRRTMESYDELPPACLGGIDGLTKSMNASINLANEAHYDCNDLGVGMSVWMEQVQDHPTDSYFVLPNLLVTDNKKQTRSGVLIKLCDGCAISWDGALIKHCTSIRTASDYQFN